jgi:hypothetical protein
MLVGLESRVTWRKGIELDRPVPQCTWLGGCYFRDVFFAGMYTQDNDKGPVYREVALADTKRYYNGRIGYGRLRFGKAGFGGIWHGNAYELRWDDAHIKDGRKYTFIWLKD